MRSLPSSSRLVVVAVLVPAAVAGTNQLLFELIPFHEWLRPWLYPWMAFTTAVLAWCVGKYLSPPWLRWLVFAWCLALLDALTLAACQDRRVEDHFGYVLVSAQTSLLILWAVLGLVAWQWRLPAALTAAPLIIGFSGTFTHSWWGSAWNSTMLLTAVIVLLLSAGLRWRGFRLRTPAADAIRSNHVVSMQSNQFGLKHMLIWATAVVPLLLVLRGVDYFDVFANFVQFERAFAAALVAVSVATINLIAIWSVLGAGSIAARSLTLVLIPPLMASYLVMYSRFLHAKYGNWPNIAVLDAIIDMHDYWLPWLWLDAALLAALLLFLRASGYRLMKTPP